MEVVSRWGNLLPMVCGIFELLFHWERDARMRAWNIKGIRITGPVHCNNMRGRGLQGREWKREGQLGLGVGRGRGLGN